MTWIFPPLSGILFLSAVISFYVAYQAVRRRGMPAASALLYLMYAVVEWALFSAMETMAVDREVKILLAKIANMGAICAPSLLFVFVLEYVETPGWRTRRNVILLAAVPLILLALTWTNDLHGLMWSSITADPQSVNALIYQPGLAGYLMFGYGWLLALIGVYLLVKVGMHGSLSSRSRLGWVLISALFPMIGGIMDLARIGIMPTIPFSPLSFSISGIILAYGIFRVQIFAILPLARDLLIENMRDGVLVLDSKNRVVDINRAAQTIIGISAVDIIGRPVSSLPDGWPDAVMLDDDHPITRKDIQIQGPLPLSLDLQITPITSRKMRINGRLIVFRDNTARRKSELELARRAEEFLVINRINTIITSGLDLDHVLKILHEQCVIVVPSDVFYVALYEKETGLIHLPLYFEKGYQAHPPRDLQQRPGVTGHVIETRRTLYIPDVYQPPTNIPVIVRMGGDPTRSYIGIPLILREKVIGVMSVQSYEPNAYTPNQIRMLEAVAVQAAIAIENAKLYGEVQRLAIVDELTGVYNFRGLLELGRREVERARRFDRPLTALFFDIDGFRNFNNVYSHATGNIVLQTVAERCRSVLRSVDVMARYGGDEFVILLPETDTDAALTIARRLREEVAATKINTTYGELGVTISLGVAQLDDTIHDIGVLVDHANRAEHRAKEKGNTVEVDS